MMTKQRMWRWIPVLVLVALVAPAAVSGDVVLLKDGSILKGTVVSLVGDTLSVRTGFGGVIAVPRSSIAQISFTDSLVTPAPATRPLTPTTTTPPAGTATGEVGRVSIYFEDDELSSKIVVVRGKDKDALLRANWIEQALIVDDVVRYSRIDSTMDKTIYNGPEKVYKNTIELENFEVEMPVGFHNAVLVVRNVGRDEYSEAFEDLLELELTIENVNVLPGRTHTIKVGITRGRLRLGEPRLERIE